MKLLVFAHTPPPHHGQSYLVQLMLEGLGGDHRRANPTRAASSAAADSYGVECYHVNARLSKRLEDIGEWRGGKLLLLVLRCLEAIWCRVRYGVTNLYYIPAPGKRSALYRDWLFMLICRPFFKRLILHWHAAGLAKWLETSVLVRTRAMTYRLMKRADLSIVLSNYNVADAEKLLPRRVRVVSNGVPDPCPDFAEAVLPRRQKRFAARARLLAGENLGTDDFQTAGPDLHLVKVLFLAHCTREKGLFAAAEAVRLANRACASRYAPVRMLLLAAGSFVTPEEKSEFDQLLADPEYGEAVQYRGFVTGDEKLRLLRESDLFCFPTCYPSENQPVNLIEAMAFGLPVVTTRWRSLPEMLPLGYPGLVGGQMPESIAAALLALMTRDTGEDLRKTFLERYTLERHLTGLAKALISVEQPAVAAAPVIEPTPT